MFIKNSLSIITALACFVILFNGCNNSSVWRDKNGFDAPSFYSSSESCQKLIGTIDIKTRLHKNALADEKDIFAGGLSSRWLTINEDSIFYYTPYGEVADKGSYQCEDGMLRVDWEVRYNRQMEYIVHFNSKDTVELRYYDYPYSFDDFAYDSTKAPNNETKILGIMR